MDVLDGRKKKHQIKIRSLEELPLKGFLICHKCGQMLTGSASKGKYQYYHYYHCNSTCGVRFNAKDANEKFVKLLQTHSVETGTAYLYKELIIEAYDAETGHDKKLFAHLKKQLLEYNTKVDRARELLLKGDLDGSDFKKIKGESERQVSIIEGKLFELSGKKEGIAPLLDKAFKNLAKLPILFQLADSQTKKNIVCSMYPEKLTFDGDRYLHCWIKHLKILQNCQFCFNWLIHRLKKI